MVLVLKIPTTIAPQSNGLHPCLKVSVSPSLVILSKQIVSW